MAFSKKSAKAGVSNNESEIEKRILVISSEIGKVASVRTVMWSEELPNIADFDVVIMDLVSLYSEVENNKIKLDNLKYPDKEAVSKLLRSNGELIVISYPETHLKQYVPIPEETRGLGICVGYPVELSANQRDTDPHYNLYWWSPIPITNILERPGTSVSIKDPRFREYFERGIKKWSFYLGLRKWKEKSTADSEDANSERWVEYNMEPIALNRYNLPIAASLSITVKEKPRHAFGKNGTRVVSTSGPVIILPPPTELTIEEAIRLTLATLYGVALVSLEPEWLRDYKVPGEVKLERDILASAQRIAAEQMKIEQKTKQLEDLTKFKKLLTEADSVLEEIVWETLEELGATVKRPDEPGKSDGWFTDYKGRKAVLEIKGKLRKSIATEDVRELEDWVSDGLAKGVDYKGILFGNHFREDPPEKRRIAFPPDVIRFAEKRHQCIVTTTQLFEAFKRVKSGEMKAEVIFDKLMETIGVCELITD